MAGDQVFFRSLVSNSNSIAQLQTELRTNPDLHRESGWAKDRQHSPSWNLNHIFANKASLGALPPLLTLFCFPCPSALKLIHRSYLSTALTDTGKYVVHARLQKFSASLYLESLEWENTGLITMFVFPQPLAGKISLAVALRKECSGRKLWPPKGKVRQKIRFPSPVSHVTTISSSKKIYFLSSTTTTLDNLYWKLQQTLQ